MQIYRGALQVRDAVQMPSVSPKYKKMGYLRTRLWSEKSKHGSVSVIKPLFLKKKRKSHYLIVTFPKCNSLDYFIIRIHRVNKHSLY